MSTRATNTTLFFLVLAQLLSGVGSYLTGTPDGRWVLWLHAMGGFALVVLLAWKGRIIVRALRRRGLGWWATPSLLLLALLLVTLATGLLWSSIGLPPVAGYTAMTVHALGAALVVLLLAPHAAKKWRRPRWSDVSGRRLLLRRGALTLAGGAAWLATEGTVRATGRSGAHRRFTGSRAVAPGEPNDFPATSWLFDDPALLDTQEWRLRVSGAVAQPLDLDLSALGAAGACVAVLDCTGGWYAERHWQGIRLDGLLDAAKVRPGARSVVIRSATGYWRRFALREARGALLASAVDGEPLSHGHGAPLRLVVPGRRGYEWVKWVTAVEVSTRGPLWKWPLPIS